MAQVALKEFLESHGSNLAYCRERIAELKTLLAMKKYRQVPRGELHELRKAQLQERQLLTKAVRQIEDEFPQEIAWRHYIEGQSWLEIAESLHDAPVSQCSAYRLQQHLHDYLARSTVLLDEPVEDDGDDW